MQKYNFDLLNAPSSEDLAVGWRASCRRLAPYRDRRGMSDTFTLNY